MNYELKPGDTAIIKQVDGETLTIRPYDHFTMITAASVGTVIKTDMDADFIMAVKVVEKEKEKPSRKSIRVRITDEVVQFMISQFPDRVGTAKIMNFHKRNVLGVEIDICGLTHGDLIHAGMSYHESVYLLGK